MSVLTLDNSSGQALSVRRTNFSIRESLLLAAGEQQPRVGEVPGDCGGRDHRGRHQMGACTRALAAAEVTVGGRSTALAGGYDVAVDADTHGAARVGPFQSGFAEDAVEAFFFRLPLDHRRARRNETW